jgi:serine/threonine-protein phosphatase 2B catalytic subunit
MRGERNMEELLKKAREEEDDAGMVERLADRIVRDRKPQGRPRALKRFETA